MILSDEWEMAKLEAEVSDLEAQLSEYNTLIMEARSIIITALHLDKDHPAWQSSAMAWLRRAPK